MIDDGLDADRSVVRHPFPRDGKHSLHACHQKENRETDRPKSPEQTHARAQPIAMNRDSIISTISAKLADRPPPPLFCLCGLPSAKERQIGYAWSYLACRIGHLVPIRQQNGTHPLKKIP
jgi:hypothetical protein